MNANDEKKKPHSILPALLAAEVVSSALIGLCLVEIVTGKSGKALGLIGPTFVWPIMTIAIPVALFCVFKLMMILRNIEKEKDTGSKQKANNKAM